MTAGTTSRFASENLVLDRVLPIGLFAVAVAICLTKFGGAINLAFPAMAVAIGVLLYFQRPTTYLSFALWLWLISPLIRRMSDYQGGFNTISILLIAPLAVTAISALSLARYSRQIEGKALLPSFVILTVLVYGFFRGALSGGLTSAALALANWSVPVLFAIHVLILPENAIDKARALLRPLVYGGLLIGVYGIYQFVMLPPWDAYWMTESGLTSIGAAAPFEVRVFSTLNSPGPFAVFVAASTLAAFTTQSRARWPSVLFGVVGLLLSLVRSTWGAWFICLMILFAWAPKAQKVNYIIAALAAILIVTPVVAITPLGATIGDRFATLSETSSDGSYQERRRLYLEFTRTALTSVFGVGLGQTSVINSRLGASEAASDTITIDSGLLDGFYSLGLLATFFFFAMAVIIFQAWPGRSDPYATTAFIVAFVNVPMMLFGNTFIAPIGILFFPFLALAISLKADNASARSDSVATEDAA